MWKLGVVFALMLSCLCGCQPSDLPRAEPTPPADGKRILRELREHERMRREQVRFADLPASSGQFGADPYAVMAVSERRFLGLNRGSSELLLFDERLAVLSRVSAPRSASGLAVFEDRVYVVGPLSQSLWEYELPNSAAKEPSAVVLTQRWALPGVYGLRGVAADQSRLFLIEEDSGRLLTFARPTRSAPHDPAESREAAHDSLELLSEQYVGEGLVAVERKADLLVINALRDHEIVLVDLRGGEERELQRIRHDGPCWSFDLLQDQGASWLLLGCVEDHPLDRTIGSFGNVDSYLYLYRIDGERRAERVAAHNLSALGVVTPKVVRFGQVEPQSQDDELALRSRFEVHASGYGSAKTLRLLLNGGALTVTAEQATPPGSANGVWTGQGLLLANPLVDRFLLTGPEPRERVEAASAEPRERLGEALFFTTLMAPFNLSEGPLSRFTCETCHFEGGVDGRIHYTGRETVKATTKPLWGLFNNRPHFSRALDRDLSQVCHAEFRVAGANSGHEPIFSVSVNEFPWLTTLNLPKNEYDALDLRIALMEFLIHFTPPSNPRVLARSEFSELEQSGALLFRDHCERCHAARLSADSPRSLQPFEEWSRYIFADNAAIVWGSAGYQKTGVTPYVHPQGARTPSLRRLRHKHPYFTNGSAEDLQAVLERVRTGDEFSHAGGAGTPLNQEQMRALIAFLNLL